MQRAGIRNLLFLGMFAVVPVFYYLGVIGGLVPLGIILGTTILHANDSGFLLSGAIHMALYGLVFFWLAHWMALLIVRCAGRHSTAATIAVLLLLAGLAQLPIYGAAHGQVHWKNAYHIYADLRKW